MIFCFSGTGNTRWVAEQLAAMTGEKLLDICQSQSVMTDNGMRRNPDSQPYRLQAGERIGFCFPIHGWQPPRIMREFIRKSDFRLITESQKEVPFCYAVCTCGDETGEAMTIFGKELQRNGLHLDSCYSIVMPNTYVCLPFMDTDSEAVQKQKLQTAKHRIREVGDDIVHYRRGRNELTKGPFPRLYSYVIGAYFNRYMISDKRLAVSSELCSHCGLCASVCPTGNIFCQHNQLPVFRHEDRCTNCLACYHHCPHHAIQYGSITRKRGQYYFKISEMNNL